MKQRLLNFLLLGILLVSCSRAELTEGELEQYMFDPENGLRQELNVDDVNLIVYYKPKELVEAQQLEGITDEAERNNISRGLDSLDYFVLQLSKNGKEIENGFVSDPVRFNEIIDYLSFYVSNDLSVICSKDTIPSFDVAYVRTFGAGKSTNVLTVFKSNLQHAKSDITVRFEDHKFGTGINEFNFDINKIKNVPHLKSNTP